MEFLDVVSNRFSCKKFSNEKVDRELLNKVLETTRLAPTAKNLQEYQLIVVESEEMLAKIDKVSPCRYNAPTVVVVAFDKDNVFTYPGGKRDSGVEDATIVATHLMLVATNYGLNSCWINFFDPEQMAKELELPENMEVLMMLDLGYGDENAKPLPNHQSRKSLDEVVKYL